ncbi:probable polygalacturonase [Humulus lupulus]|uniref:probable polygalacturonase n=1 Tax=Humulus lupulus TaxID=3486 RepID=UPI002B401A87|nr:probable polygalacturonase [Humulus lupulus]
MESKKSHIKIERSLICVLGVLVLILGECSTCIEGRGGNKNNKKYETDGQVVCSARKHSAVLTEFGGVGDGITSNTKAFKAAVDHLSPLASDGGAQLIVPPGKWLTGSFNLTSHFTLFLHKDAVILGSQDESEWPYVELLPSYGVGRDAPNARFSSLIYGTNLTDVVITGHNGTIDGQGSTWWTKFRAGQLNATRPYLIEILYSDQVQIFNLTLIDSPSWFVHPIYSSNVVIQGLTILAPIDSPNTDGIDPDSCTNTRIEDCFIVSGDDCIAVKSGWDQYGIKVGMPTEHLVIRRVTCISPDSATIALGSEMSGGIRDVRAEDITALNTQSAVRIKTAPGRGAYVKDIFARRFIIKTMKYVFWMTGSYNSHPDKGYDPKAMPEISAINYRDWVAENVTYPARLDGINGDPFKGICISNMAMTLAQPVKKLLWNCSNVEGHTSNVTPKPCSLLPENPTKFDCPFPEDKLPIEDVPLKTCSYYS